MKFAQKNEISGDDILFSLISIDNLDIEKLFVIFDASTMLPRTANRIQRIQVDERVQQRMAGGVLVFEIRL